FVVRFPRLKHRAFYKEVGEQFEASMYSFQFPVRLPKVLGTREPIRRREPYLVHYFWYLTLLQLGLKFLKCAVVLPLFWKNFQRISNLLFQLFGLLPRQWCSILCRSCIALAIWHIVRRSFGRKKWFSFWT